MNLKKHAIYVSLAITLLSALIKPSLAGDVKTAPAFMPNFPMLASDNVMLMWVPVKGAVKYNIYMNGKLIGEVPAPPFKHKAPTEPGSYKYIIRGVDKAGVEGPASIEGVLPFSIPQPPVEIKYKFLGGVLNIRWEGTPGTFIYDIFRSDTKDSEYKLVASVTDTRYVDTDIVETENIGKSFFYKIVSKDKFNKPSSESEILEVYIEGHICPPGPPAIPLKVFRSKEDSFVKPFMASSCYDAAFLSDGESLVIVDTLNRSVSVINNDGKRIRPIGKAGNRPDQLGDPIRVAVDEDDNVYILDNKKQRIFAYDSKGELMYHSDYHKIDEDSIVNHYYEVSSKIKMPFTPRLNGIAVSGANLYAVDKITGVVQVYNKNSGNFIDYLRDIETAEILYFGIASKLLISGDGKLYVSQPLNRVIDVIDVEAGKKLYQIGTTKSFIGAFASINGLAFDAYGNIVVSDGVMHSVQVFSKDNGSYLYHIGGEKAAPEPVSKDQRPKVDFDFAGPVNVDKKGRVWVWLGKDKGFSVRELIGDKPWNIDTDEPEL